MSKKKSSVAGLGALYARVCGMDVHKNSVVACVRILNAKDGTVQSTLRRFGTMTADLLELRQWLREQQVTHAAMESTGVYWQPVFNLLEGHLEVWVVNAQHIKKVPGRKTDMKDAEWIAQLMQCGLLKPSFVPEREQRELRDLTRQQSKLVQQRNAVDNRIQKVLETANIKLGSVASDVLGVSGRRMIEALIAGEKDTSVLADLAQKKLREKIPQLQRALEGEVSEHHRFLLRQLLDQYDFLEKEIARVSERVGAVAPSSFRAAVEQLDAIAGVGERGARALLAETGTDMSRFPSHKHVGCATHPIIRNAYATLAAKNPIKCSTWRSQPDGEQSTGSFRRIFPSTRRFFLSRRATPLASSSWIKRDGDRLLLLTKYHHGFHTIRLH